MRNFFKALTICIFSILICFSASANELNAPAVDIYVMVFDTETFYKSPAVVEVKIESHTIHCEVDTCPAEDIRLPGEAFSKKGDFLGMRMVTVKKGYLTDPKNKDKWSYDHPNHKQIRGNNFEIWDV